MEVRQLAPWTPLLAAVLPIAYIAPDYRGSADERQPGPPVAHPFRSSSPSTASF